ncbi:MAG: GntR family transcriptional regulator [Chloroflexota bacterium]
MTELSTTTPLPRRTLAEQMAASLTEAIIAGQFAPGEALPTEPELAEQFGVSRAVVRDATRMLVARGLVDAQHGRGVFVTDSPIAPFGDALLLALRRTGATAWDVERFNQMVLPDVMAEATRQATEEDLNEIRRLADAYKTIFNTVTRRTWDQTDPPSQDQEISMAAFRSFYRAIFMATHNALWSLLIDPLLRLRMPRSWDSSNLTVDEFIDHENRLIDAWVAAIVGRDPDQARSAAAELVSLPPEAETAMRATPVGEIPQIPVTLPPSSAI